MFETIVALATPPLKSALAVIRLSGDDCFDVVSKCFSKDIRKTQKRTIFIGSLFASEEKIDDVVLLAYKGPKSFTGEDSVEIMCHGSMLIANQIIETLISCGARMATNGEFSSRAFLHQKLDLVQAESINDLINATTKESKHISMMSLDGNVSSLIVPIKTRLADILSLIEVNIDYPEYEDIEVANKDLVISVCDEVIGVIDNLIKDGEIAKIIKDGIKVAIVGKPNVGKSSLLNTLLGEDKAIVTDIEGTTRDIVEGEVSFQGIPLHLLDTAGIRNTSDKIESIGINKSIKSIEEADLVIVVIDASREIDAEDNEILELTKNYNRIIVNNKSDKALNKDLEGIYISAANNDVEALKTALYEKLGINEQSFKRPALNNARQLGLLKQAKQALETSKNNAISDLSIDLISVDLMAAYTAVLEILGEANQLDLSKEIFSRFCVGK
jgi:tRNA modification GTPase